MLRELNNERLSISRAFEQAFLFVRSRSSAIRDIAFISLIGIVGFVFGTQGWNSRIPAFDMLTYFENARNFLATGALPAYGDISSYGSFSPPGTAWFMIPGMLVFNDPRHYEFVGSAILHLGTLLGLYLLAKTYFGNGCAYLSILIYGLSNLGFSLAGSLWPIGHPFFYVWMVYLSSLWVIRGNATYLAAALVVWALGINVDLALLPAVFLLPVLWLMFRPSLHWRPLLVAFTLSLIIWFPYLRFEAGRVFADLRSQALLKNIVPEDYKTAWCNPDLNFLDGTTLVEAPTLDSPQSGSSSNLLHVFGRLLLRGNTIIEGLLANLVENTSVLIIHLPLLLMILSSLFVVSLAGMSGQAIQSILQTRLWRSWLTLLAVVLIFLGLLANELLISQILQDKGGLTELTRLSIRRFQVVFVLIGLILLARNWIAAFLNRTVIRDISNESVRGYIVQSRLIALSLLIPWMILLLVAEPGRPERFFWLWPLHALFLAVFAIKVFPQFRAPRVVNWMFLILLVVAVVGIPVLSKLETWQQTGWAGPSAEEVQVADFIARQLQAESRAQVAIGYQIFFYPFMASYHILNPGYKVGAEFDSFLKFRYGIANANQCAEGISPNDQYRIVQAVPMSEAQAPRTYFQIPVDSSFKLVSQFGSFQVFVRQ